MEKECGIKVIIITEEKYERLERWFKKKIDSQEDLAGWETSEDNLKTNPDKYRQEDYSRR